jgi:hypothetical protein
MSRIGAIALLGLLLLVSCGDEEEPVATGGEEPTTVTAATTTEGTAADEATARAAEDEAEAARPATVEDTIEAVLTGSVDAAVICDELATEKYVRTAYGAREGCIAAQRPGALADSVGVEGMIRNESGPGPAVAATAVVIPAGGPYDGVEVEVGLVRDAGGWQVDSLVADVPAGP